jgi:putative restriction endonuclease
MMSDLRPTDLIQGEIVRISNSGNGVLNYDDGEISIGPIRPEAVGQEVDAIVYDENHAFCLDESIQTEYYDNIMKAQTRQLLENPPDDSPGLGESIDVRIEGVNSSGHGPATYKGIPIRVRNIPPGISSGDTATVKIYRLEPSRFVATGETDISIRGSPPDVGDIFQATISRRTNSGNGLIESFVGSTINIGPIRESVPEKTIKAVLLDEEWAYCLTDSVVDENYDDVMAPRVSNSEAHTLEELQSKRQRNESDISPNRIIRGQGNRKDSFRYRVRRAYDAKCAICGQRITDPSGEYVEGESAHIYPVDGVEPEDRVEGGPDTIRNGLYLCRTHHWTFDHDWFIVEDDYTITVTVAPDADGYDVLKKYDDEQLLLPNDRSQWPAKHYIEAHRNKVVQK